MKRNNFIFLIVALSICVFLFSGCSTQKNYEMSYEQVISLFENQIKEIVGIFFNFDVKQKYANLTTKFDTDAIYLDLDILSQARINYASMLQDRSISFDADVKISESEFGVSTSGSLNYSLIWDNVYLNLSKFSLGWPSAKDLAMINMVVNGVKWQQFKLAMSGFNLFKSFYLYNLYNERLGKILDNVWEFTINEGAVIYYWMFDEYKWYNAWKYSIDEEKVDEMLELYADVMDEFNSWMLTQYLAQNLWTDDVNLIDFSNVLSGITYDNLQWYFVVVWKNKVVWTVEGAHITLDKTWIIFNYYYGKDWLCFEAKTENWEDFMLLVAKKNWISYDIYTNIMSVLGIKWNVKFNKFSKGDGIDVDFDLIFAVNTDQDVLSGLNNSKQIYLEVPVKWNYQVKNIDKFSLQEPDDAIDLMEMVGGYLWTVGGEFSDDYELDDSYEFEDIPVELE